MNIVSSIDDSKIFFIDEVGFNVCMRSSQGRSLKGTRAIKIVPSLRSRNISICCAMTKNGIFDYKVQTSAFNCLTFLDFVDSLINKLEAEGIQSAVIVMDNVAFHKNIEIKNKIENEGHQILFLPPYSPFLNPIENMFSKWKQLVRSSNPENEEQLFASINNCASLINQEDCGGYYRHIFRFMIKIRDREPIFD